ncbi:RNA polymerase sigma factor [Altererythrobacter sp. MTPC7]|uniref:RNA polymerase sigma factor n=1 Tax=Altererythrobacter sp. MTPC7 TaxID=3056567 RepID=UPI0036F32828
MDCRICLQKIAEGSESAFEQLYSAMKGGLVAQAQAILAGDMAAAEDAVDEAFLHIWQNADRYAGHGAAAGWIRRIVRNKAIDRLRKEGRRVSILPPESFSEIVDTGPRPDAPSHARDMTSRIAFALGSLSPAHRECVTLAYFNELSVQDIADATGVPVGTVKTRLHYARKVLRKALGSSELEACDQSAAPAILPVAAIGTAVQPAPNYAIAC